MLVKHFLHFLLTLSNICLRLLCLGPCVYLFCSRHFLPQGLHCPKIVKPPQSLPLQMAECLLRAQPDSVANRITYRSISDRRALTWLATETGWARNKHSAICSDKPHTSCQVPRCHVHACCSHFCELVNAQALSTHRSRVLVRCQFSLPAYTRVTNFCYIFGRGNGAGLYAGRLIREYIRYMYKSGFYPDRSQSHVNRCTVWSRASVCW